MGLFEIRLPAGDCKGIDIDYAAGTGRTKLWSKDWLSQGYDGIRLIGHASGTHLRPVGDQALLVVRHNGAVQLEGITVHCGARQGIWFGLEGKHEPTLPKFTLIMRGCEVVADMPLPGSLNQHTTVWPIFGYQHNADLEDVDIFGERSAEHDYYLRGFASKAGFRANRVRLHGSGSQGLKFRNTPLESNWVKGARIHITDSTIKNWHQPWTWRGPGGLVVEGGGCDIRVERTEFLSKPGPEHCRAIMIDDAKGDFFDAETGAVGRGFANGHILIDRCGLNGGPGTENYTPLLRVSNNGAGAWKSCRSLTVTNSGLWGDHTQVQLGNIPVGKTKIAECNTPALRAYGDAHGYDTRFETGIPGPDRVEPVSKGLVR